jgi:CheY-like chemotaxis protein
VTLPLTDERPDDAVSATVKAMTPAERATLRGVRVLVVEDEADSRGLFRTILEQSGADVAVAESAESALAALERAMPDVLVSDIGLSGEDGYDLLRRVSERGWQLPALALTAYARIEDRERALEAGYRLHLPKPIEPTDLAAAVATLAGRTESAQP